MNWYYVIFIIVGILTLLWISKQFYPKMILWLFGKRIKLFITDKNTNICFSIKDYRIFYNGMESKYKKNKKWKTIYVPRSKETSIIVMDNHDKIIAEEVIDPEEKTEQVIYVPNSHSKYCPICNVKMEEKIKEDTKIFYCKKHGFFVNHILSKTFLENKQKMVEKMIKELINE